MGKPEFSSEQVPPVERVRRVFAGLRCTPAEIAALLVLAGGAVAALGLLWLLAGPPDPAGRGLGAGEVAGGDASPGLAIADGDVVVHVAGRVAEPGLYTLAGGARIADALAAAGGPLPDAVLDSLNLARPLTDGEQLVIPGPVPDNGETGGNGPAGAGGTGGAEPSAWRPDGTLDLNRASAADLEELPGIGPVLAQRIIEHREDNGPFAAPSDLRQVRGIGERTLSTLLDLVST